MIKYYFQLIAVSLLLFFSACEANNNVTFVHNGTASAVVVTADDATGTALYAADELVDHIEKATGVRLPLAVESAVPDGYKSRIYVGMTRAALEAGIDAEDMGPDEFILRTQGPDLYVVGLEDPERDLRLEEPKRTERHILDTGDRGHWPISKNGTLFGVYEVLQRFVGVRWLWPGELGTYTPRTERLVIDEKIDEFHEPALKFRRFRWWGVYRDASRNWTHEHDLSYSSEGFVSYWRDLGVFLGRHRLGQTEEKPPVGHYFSGWWPRYGSEHPEWFGMDSDGSRGSPNPEARHVAMCFSNPELHEYIVNEAWDGGDFLRLGDIDSRSAGVCQCEDCLAWDGPQPVDYPESVSRDYQPQMVSDRNARFWKTIQEMAAERNPDVTVTTFLYWNYFPAPQSGIELNDNIYGEFCPWTGEGAYYPMPDEVDTWLREQWKGWVESGIRIAYRPNLLHGGYVLPNFSTWQAGEFFRFAAEHGMEGIDFDSLYGQWATRGLMLYMYMRLSWDPELEIQELRNDYFSAFGPAAEQVERYFDYWEEYSQEHGGGGYYHGVRRARNRYPDEVFEEAAEILDGALSAAQQHQRSEYAERVDFLKAGLEHASLSTRAMSYFDEAGNTPLSHDRFMEARRKIKELVEFRREHEHLYIADFNYAARAENRTGDIAGFFDEYLADQKTDMEVVPHAPGVLLDEMPDSVFIRNEATYLLHAEEGEQVDFRIRARQLGSQPGDVTYMFFSPDGDLVKEGEVLKGESENFVFEPRQTGVYTIVCSAGRNAVNVSSTGRLSILQTESRNRLRVLGGSLNDPFYFFVPAETTNFEINVQGRGDWVYVYAEIINPEGEVIEKKDNISGISPHTFSISRENATEGEVWSVKFARASEGAFQDFFFSLGESLPPILSVRQDTLLIPLNSHDNGIED